MRRWDALRRSPGIALAVDLIAGGWVVGGAVRDALMGRDVVDADLAVEPGSEEAAARAIARASGGAAFPLSEEFGTWRVVSADRSWHVDVTRLRADGIDGDLALRDFTVNAIAVPLSDLDGEPIDPTGGIGGRWRRGVLRAVSERSFADDPLRLMRAARIAAALGPGDRTRDGRTGPRGIGARRGARRRAAARRAAAAGLGCGAAARPRASRRAWRDCRSAAGARGAARRRAEPEPPPGRPRPHDRGAAAAPCGRVRPGAVHGRERRWRARAAREPLGDDFTRGDGLRLGALLHDTGKPATKGSNGGYVTFIGHDSVGADLVDESLGRLKA